MKTRLIILIAILLASCAVYAGDPDYETRKWEVLDLKFTAKIKPANPFGVQFGGVLKHENGQSMNVPGFHNGNGEWIIRVSLPETGTWSYETWSSEPKLASLKGSVNVLPVQKADEHGPVAISKNNPQKFVYANGSPYFLMAFELDWLFALDAQNPDGIPKTKEIIDEVAINGFNQVVMNVYAYDAGWGERDHIKPEYNYAEPEVFPFGGTNENPDFSTLNIGFFKHLDRVMAHLDDKEIIAHLMIYVWNKKVNWPESESEADNMYFDYVVKRYQAYPNLIWDISKEALAYGHNDMGYITNRIERLEKLDAHERLLSVHDYAYCARFPGEVDFISIQDWRPNIYDRMLEVADKHPDKPVFNIEHGGYEKTMHSIFDGAYTDAEVCLDRNYRCIFAGTYSTYYWQNSSWYEVVYNPSSLPKEQQPHFEYFKYLTGFFDRYPFNQLEPSGAGSAFCLSDKKSVYLFYLTPGMIAATGDVSGLKGKTVQLRWFDPLTGSYIDGDKRSFDNGTWISIKKHEKITSPFCILIMEIV